MPQFDNPNPFSQAGNMTPPAERKTSGLAVTSLIMSIIFCCPLTTIPAFIMGLIAVVKTGPQTAFKGRGLAIAAILISVIGTGIQIYGGSKIKEFFDAFKDVVENKPQEVMGAGFQGDWTGFRDGVYLTSGSSFTDEEADLFIQTLRDRYGEMVSITLDEPKAEKIVPNFSDPKTTFPYHIKFEQVTLDATATIIWADPNQSGGLIMKVGSITILDPNLGDVTFPAAESEGADDAAEGESSPDATDGG